MADTAYYPPAVPAQERGGGSPGPVLVAVAEPARQRRATVLFRLILAVPHFIALYALGVAASVIVFIGWFCALATGRLPGFAGDYLSGYLRWNTRLAAYLFLLTDQYPAFSLQDDAYPVRLAVVPGKTSRLTAAFRVLLAIPAAILAMLLGYGAATIVAFVAWLTALALGRLPRTVHQGFAAILRYNARYQGYLLLLTGTYPAGLFGDRAAEAAQLVETAQPLEAEQGVDIEQAAPQQAYSPSPAADWKLVLSPGAKRFVGLILALGVLTAAGCGAAGYASIHAIQVRDDKINQLNVAVAQLNSAIARHNAAVSQEAQEASQLNSANSTLTAAYTKLASLLSDPSTDFSKCSSVACFTAMEVKVADGFAAFGQSVNGITVPADAASKYQQLVADTAKNQQNWLEGSKASSFTDIENQLNAAQTLGDSFDSDNQALSSALNNDLGNLANASANLTTEASSLGKQAAALDEQAATLGVTLNLSSPALPAN